MSYFQLRVLSALLFIPATASGDIRILGEAVDLADSVNPASVVSWDADGNGTEEIITFDPLKSRITVSTTGVIDPPSLLFRTETTGTFARVDVSEGNIFLADVNDDTKPDLVFATSGQIEIWHGKTRNLALVQEPDWSLDMPRPEFGFREYLSPADVDGDGQSDLVSTFGNFIVFGIGSDNPVTSEGIGNSGSAFQIVENWDASGKTVLAAGSLDLPLTVVFEILPDRSLVEIDRVDARGTLVNLTGNFPPQLTNVVGLRDAGIPLAFIHTKNGASWTQESIPSPPGSQAVIFPDPLVVQALKSPSGSNRETLVITGGGAHDILIIKQGMSGLELTRRPISGQSSATAGLPVIFMSALPIQGIQGDALAVFFARNPIPNIFGSFHLTGQVQGIALNVILPNQSLPSDDLFKGIGSVGRTLPIDANADGRMDLISLQFGTSGLAAHFQPAYPDSVRSSLALPGVVNAQEMVKGNFTDAASQEIAVLSNGITHFYSLDEGVPVETGDTYSGDFLLSAGDLVGSGTEEVIFINGRQETLNHSGSIHPIALAGRTPPSSLGVLGGAPPKENSYYVTRDQILVTDADKDGDNDIITFPSALGQVFGFHRNDNGRFSVQRMTSDPIPFPYDNMIDGFRTGNPSQLFLGKFLSGSSGKTLGCYTAGTDIFFSPTNSFIVFSGRLDQSVAVSSNSLSILGQCLVTDFDGDGLDDIIMTGKRSTNGFGNPVLNTSILFYRSVGDGTFEPEILLGNTLGAEVSQFFAEDMNADGLPDIIAVSQEAGSLQLFLSSSVPSYPSFSNWASSHASSAPGILDDPDGSGIPNLIRFATGTLPFNNEGTSPLAPPIQPTIKFDGTFLTASHPIPRLSGGDRVDVKVEYSSDMITWLKAEEPYSLSNEVEYPQWQSKSWDYVHLKDSEGSNIESPEHIFLRFAVTYVPGP